MQDMNPIVLSLFISMAIQAFFFIFAASFKTDKVTDLSYGLSFIAIANYFLFISDTAGLFEVALAVMVSLWGLRIAGYLLFRILKTGTDRRFDDKRDDLVEFGKFWLLQGIAVWAITIPVVYLITRGNGVGVPIWAVVGSMIWVIGITIETVADAQLYNFRFNKETDGKWIDEGLWHYSRHPNYFGEMIVWWGLFVYGFGVFEGFGWISIIGPLFITLLLRYGSGVPPLEKSHDKRWGDQKEYQKYKRSTNLLVIGPKG